MKKVRDIEDLLKNTKFVIIMIVCFVVMGINLSAETIYREKYSQNISQKIKENSNQSMKDTEKKSVKKQSSLEKNIKDRLLDETKMYYRDTYDQSPLTDDEWDNVKKSILSRADEIRQKRKISFQ